MKWNLNYIQKNAKPSFNFEENIEFENDLIKKINGLYGLNNLKVSGKLKYIETIGICIIEYKVEGIMQMKCALTNEDLNYYFADEDSISFKFYDDGDDDFVYAKGNTIDLIPYIWHLIVVNVPLRVVKEGAKLNNLTGKNWKIGENDEKLNTNERKIDPRLESLKNYFDKH